MERFLENFRAIKQSSSQQTFFFFFYSTKSPISNIAGGGGAKCYFFFLSFFLPHETSSRIIPDVGGSFGLILDLTLPPILRLICVPLDFLGAQM